MANHSRRIAVAATALTLALGLGACGKGDTSTTLDAVSPEEAKALMFRGIDKAAATKSVQYTSTSRVHMIGGTTPSLPGMAGMAECYAATSEEETTAYGGIDNASGAAIGGLSRGVVQTVDPDFANLEDKTLYVSRDVVPEGWPVTKPWLLVETNDLFTTGLLASTGFTSGPSFAPSSRSTPGTFEPTDLLEDLRDAARSVTSSGDEDVDGVPTRHLRIELDPDKLANLDNGGTTTTIRRSAEEYGPATAEAWIDSDDRVRRLSVSLSMTFDPTLMESTGSLPSIPELSGFSMPTGMEISYDIRFFAYDEPLPVAVPTVDQVQDIGDLPASVVLDGPCGFGSMTPPLPSDPTTDTPEMKAYVDCMAAETRKATDGVTWREYRAKNFSFGSISNGSTSDGLGSACTFPMPDFGQFADQLGPAFGIPTDTPEGKACVEAMGRWLTQSVDATSPTTMPSPLTPGTGPPECEEFFVSTGPGGPWGPNGSIPPFPTIDDPQMRACTDALSRLDPNQPPPPEPPAECRDVIPPGEWSPFDTTTSTSAP